MIIILNIIVAVVVIIALGYSRYKVKQAQSERGKALKICNDFKSLVQDMMITNGKSKLSMRIKIDTLERIIAELENKLYLTRKDLKEATNKLWLIDHYMAQPDRPSKFAPQNRKASK